MNYMLLAAGVVSAMTTAGHFTVGSKEFLQPRLKADLAPIPKKIMHCAFHYISVVMVTSTIVLLALGAGLVQVAGAGLLVMFIAFQYALFAMVQIVLARASGIDKPLIKLFQ